jgi:hypothetical protein
MIFKISLKFLITKTCVLQQVKEFLSVLRSGQFNIFVAFKTSICRFLSNISTIEKQILETQIECNRGQEGLRVEFTKEKQTTGLKDLRRLSL